MNRRQFLSTSTALAAVSALRVRAASTGSRPPHILLRGSWQSVNIGDIGHTLGGVRLFEKYFPEAEVTLWPGQSDGTTSTDENDARVQALLVKTFPRLRFAEGKLDAEGRPTTPALRKAWDEADIMVHGSSSGFGARGQLAAFHRVTGKPIGTLGVGMDPVSGFGSGREPEGGTLDELRARAGKLPANHLDANSRWVIDRAAFLYCRETISRDYLQRQGVQSRVLEFGPDTQFGMEARDATRAEAYLNAHRLEPDKFICVVPRLRYTPYYRIRNTRRTAADDVRDAINQRTTEPDHQRLRDLMTFWVRNTGQKVLACPEMTYQVELAKEVLVDPLPEDVKRNVVWKDSFWMPDEAASVYTRAAAVVSMECHSPIIALAAGTPAIYVRQPTDTCKGHMYRDVGVSEWIVEVEQTSGAKLWGEISRIHADLASARQRAREVAARVADRHRTMVQMLARTVQEARTRRG